MLKKNTSIIILSIILFSCNVSKRNEAEKIIHKFQAENVLDRRETIFDISAVFEKGKTVIKGETDNPELKGQLLVALKPLKFTDEIVLLPDSTVGNKIFGLINLSVANLRSKPTHSAELASQALLGTPVKILKTRNGWFLIQTPDKYISWVDAAGIEPISEEQLTKWKQSKRIIYSGDNTMVYETENMKIPVSDVTMGNLVEETSRNYRTINVRLPDGRTGFISKVNWIDFEHFKNTVKPDTTQLKQMAIQFTGRPYLWGGTSARAMDCSGFIKTLYFMNGIILARDASLQTKYGNLVDTHKNFTALQTGDLLFFGRKRTPELPEKVTHVALSLGGTEYIHAAGKVKRNSFNSESKVYSKPRINSFVRARRIIGATKQDGIQQLKTHPWY
ncbi:MAG: C40 family peptidase [Draconibacterium sp.]|nr:C40 family peptidase [Draconibacterium sp.]